MHGETNKFHKRIEQELFVGCLCGSSIHQKTSCLWWFKQPIFDSRDYDSGWFRAGQSSDSKFQDPARKIMEFLFGDEILGFVDELLFFLW